MQAIMLAAGKGAGLGKYTKNNTKCMVEVNGKTLLERSIESLEKANIDKLIMVIGHKGANLKKFISDKGFDKRIKITYVENEEYETTNNIYSLFLAKDYLSSDDTIILESDVIFDNTVIESLVNFRNSNAVVVAKYKHWMNGMVTILDDEDNILEFIEKGNFDYNNIDNYYKTCCIYKFSKEYINQYYLPFLEAYIKANGKNNRYELVLKILNGMSNEPLKAFKLEKESWYEIDDCQDLDIASVIFSEGEEKLKLYQKRFGGYWRFEDIKDFCYLVNPYFPTTNMVNKMKYNYSNLLDSYPSTMTIQNNCMSRLFNVDENSILVGNGATELINQLGYILTGKVGVLIPTFNEYIRCLSNCEIVEINTKLNNYVVDKEFLLSYIDKIDNLVFVNPDNATGSFMKYDDIMEIVDVCCSNGKKLIFDESFIDFADEELKYTLLNDEILEKYPNLIVIKSIGKSFGVPGLRLGVLACSNKDLLKKVKGLMPVWNINSFAEYFLQIFAPYKKDYVHSCLRIAEERNLLIDKLNQIKEIKIYNSQANYLMIKLLKGNSKDFTLYLLDKHKILVKDLSTKNGFEEQKFIRMAVKEREDNNLLYGAIKDYFEQNK